jgi:UDP-N-acetylglucosamine 1-carboxyvinyltransferase
VEGVKELQGTSFAVIPDRIEALTLILAGAITRSSITVKKLDPEHLDAALKKLIEAGYPIETGPDWVKISKPTQELKSLEITTLPYPAFPTDAQSQFSSLLATIPGTSLIKETVFENRFMHVPELCRMGARVKIDHQTAIIEGVKELSAAPVRVSDLRAGAALFLAALVADGETIVEDGEKHLERGYEDLPGKLISLGAKIVTKDYEGPQQEKGPTSKVESYQVEAYTFGF